MAAGQSPLSCCMQVAGAQEPRSYSVRPWHHSLALARKVNHRLIFSHSAKKDSTQLRFLSLPAKKTVWERERIKRGGEGNSWGHLDWTSSKTQRVVFFEEKKARRGKKSCLGSSWTSNSILGYAVFGLQAITPNPWAVFVEWLGMLLPNYNQRGKVVTYSGEQRNAVCAFVWGNHFAIGSLIFIHIAWVLLISSSFSIKLRADMFHWLALLCGTHGRSRRSSEQT